MNPAKKILVFLPFLLFLTGVLEAQQLFYFSSEKTFSPSEKKRVKLEASPILKSLQVRVYQIQNPIDFYLKQENFHRPEIGKREFRRYSLEVADGFFNYLKSGIQNYVREKWPHQNRQNSLSFLPELKGKLHQEQVNFSTVIKPLADSNYKLVKDFNHTLPSMRNSGNWSYSYIFLDDLKEGTYLIEGIENGHVAYTVLNISGFGFILKKSDSQVLIYAVNNENGSPLKKVDFNLFDRFKKKKEKWTTDNDGLVFGEIEENEFFVAAKSEKGSYSFYDPKFYPVASKNLRVYMYTERPVYRGGDEVSLKGMIRKYNNGEYSIPGLGDIAIEIINQRGEVVSNLNTRPNDMGSFYQKFTLPENASTGRYMIIASIDGQKYEAEFKVEYYQKPEFEVKVKMDKPFYVGGEKINAEVQADYYYGEPVKNSKVSYSIYRSRFLGEQNTDFLSQQEFQFAQMELLQQGEAQLDSKGNAKIKIETKKEKDLYLYHIEARVTDQSGVGITGKAKVEVVTSILRISAAAEKFLYLMGEKINLKILTRDYFQNPVASSLNVKISCQLAKDNTYIFMDEKVSTNEKGEKEISFKAIKTGFVKIEIKGQDKYGNPTVFEKYLWIGEEGAAYFYQGGAVQMVLDKSSYKIGDTAKLLLISPVSDIPFLFTLEGDQIYQHKIQKFDKNSAMTLIPVTKNFTPNVFATIQFIFQNQIYSNTIQLRIPAVSQALSIQVLPEKNTYAPQSNGKVKIKVKDNQGNPVKNAELSVAIVDEAIYGISPELAVGIHDFFYPLRRNNVKTWNSIGFRFYGYSKNAREQMANYFKTPTGLGAFKEKEAKERKNFKDTLIWIPEIKTDKAGEADISFTFPDNITKWRITAVGITEDTKVGKSTGFTTTKMSLFAQVANPVFINENDKTVFYSVIHNVTDKPVKAKVTATGSNLIFSKKEQEVIVDAKSTKTVEWEAVASLTGAASFTIDVKSPEFADKITKKMIILPHSILQTKTSAHSLTASENKTSFDLPKGIRTNSLMLELNLSYGYYSIIASAMPYLIGYPWGCVEQTTSSFLPNLIALKSLKQLGIQMPEVEKKLPDIISKGLARLYQFQNPNGSWGWWNEGQADTFMTAYVLYALTLTKKLGYAIHPAVFSKGIDALIKNLSATRTQTEKMFALYVLSLNKKFFPAILEQMEKDATLNSYSNALLAMTYQLSGNPSKAREIVQKLKAKKKQGAFNTFFWAEENSSEWYRDSVEATAWAIRAINMIEFDQEIIEKSVNYLMINREGSQWKSTRDTSAVIFALTDLMGKDKNFQDKTFTLFLNGKELGSLEVSKKEFQTRLVYPYSMISKIVKETSNQLEVKGISGNEKSYLSVSLSYFTQQSKINESYAGVNVKRNYFELETYQASDGTIKYKIGKQAEKIKQGKDILVRLALSSNKSGNYLMLEDFYPAGCVPVKDFKAYQIDGLKNYKNPSFADYRDEKVGFFATSLNQTMEIYYVLRSVHQGRYKVLPAQGRLMYFPVISGNSNDNDLVIE